MSDFKRTITKIAEETKSRFFFTGHPEPEKAEIFRYGDIPVYTKSGKRIQDFLLVFEFVLDQTGDSNGLTVFCTPYYTPKHWLDDKPIGPTGSDGTRLEHYSLIGIRHAMSVEQDKARSIIGQFAT